VIVVPLSLRSLVFSADIELIGIDFDWKHGVWVAVEDPEGRVHLLERRY